jgi:hypothetical protein
MSLAELIPRPLNRRLHQPKWVANSAPWEFVRVVHIVRTGSRNPTPENAANANESAAAWRMAFRHKVL